MTGIARINTTQQTHYLRKNIKFNTANIGTGVVVGTVPAGADIIGADAKVFTAFNAATTNVLTVGTTAAANELITAADVTEGTPAQYPGAKTNSGFYTKLTVDTDIIALYTQTGTAATTGEADILISYMPNNDQ